MTNTDYDTEVIMRSAPRWAWKILDDAISQGFEYYDGLLSDKEACLEIDRASLVLHILSR